MSDHESSTEGEEGQVSCDTHGVVAPAPSVDTSSAGGEGQKIDDTHACRAPSPADTEPPRAEVQARLDTQRAGDLPAERTPSASAPGQRRSVTHAGIALALAETIDRIRYAHRERNFWMEQRKRSDLALGAFLRTDLGWSLNIPPAGRKVIEAEAQEIIAAAERFVKEERKAVAAVKKGKLVDSPELPDILRRHPAIADVAIYQVRIRSNPEGGFDYLEGDAEKRLVTLAGRLPVASWVESIHGFGLKGLGIIIGEAGDLNLYPTPASLWTRMGVGIREGRRQGGLPKTASAAEWIAEKYSPKRRSRLYTVGDAMIKQAECPYRQVYLDRKVFEAAKAAGDGLIVAPSAKIPKGKQAQYRSLMHIHKRSQRYMEKRLLKDLWRAWRRTMDLDEGEPYVAPLGSPQIAAE